jgi:hypothetical protein
MTDKVKDSKVAVYKAEITRAAELLNAENELEKEIV